jgi:hypothetical protein
MSPCGSCLHCVHCDSDRNAHDHRTAPQRRRLGAGERVVQGVGSEAAVSETTQMRLGLSHRTEPVIQPGYMPATDRAYVIACNKPSVPSDIVLAALDEMMAYMTAARERSSLGIERINAMQAVIDAATAVDASIEHRMWGPRCYATWDRWVTKHMDLMRHLHEALAVLNGEQR